MVGRRQVARRLGGHRSAGLEHRPQTRTHDSHEPSVRMPRNHPRTHVRRVGFLQRAMRSCDCRGQSGRLFFKWDRLKKCVARVLSVHFVRNAIITVAFMRQPTLYTSMMLEITQLAIGNMTRNVTVLLTLFVYVTYVKYRKQI